MAKIIGFSGSPINNSNTDRVLKRLLESSGHEYEFIKLSKLNIKPCFACKGCAKDSICVIKDDFIEVAEKIKAADALVIASYTPYGVIDGFTKSLLERFYSLHHRIGHLKGKYLTSIVSSIDKKAQKAAHGALVVESLIEKMKFVDALNITGSLPCYSCSYVDDCKTSGVKGMHGSDAKVSVDYCIKSEVQDVWDQAKETGEKLGRLLDGKEEYVQGEVVLEVINGMEGRRKANV